MKKSVMVSGMNFGTEILNNLYRSVIKAGGTEEQIFEKLKTGSPLYDKWAEDIIGNTTHPFSGNEYLKLLSGNEQYIVSACEDKVIEESDGMFSYVDSDFAKYGANEKGNATLDMPFDVYELQKSGTFADFFTSVTGNLDAMCFTHGQIRSIVKRYRNWLRGDGWANFFLFKSKGKFFVAYVNVYADGALLARVRRFGHDGVWSAERHHRVFLPAKLAA